VSLIGYLGVAYAFMADVFIWGEKISAVEVCGTVAILAVTFLVAFLKLN
jgi:drug/metabolite transporter (DMT)-like permease